MTLESYFCFIAPQWYDLLFKFDLKYARHFRRVAGSLYSLLVRRSAQLGFSYFTKPVIEPLLGLEILSVSQFRIGVENMRILFVDCTEPNWLTLSQIPVELVSTLFEVYAYISLLGNMTQPEFQQTQKSIESIVRLYIRMKPSGDELKQFMIGLFTDSLLKNKLEINLEVFKGENLTLDKDDKIFYLI